jgi:DNA-binding CsgD family transcriptional regulator
VALDGALHLARGAVPEAERALTAPLPDGADRGVSWAWLLFGRARVSLALADPQAALRHAADCSRALLARGWDGPAALPWRELTAVAHFAAGDQDAARATAADALGRAHAWGEEHTIARARRIAERVGESGTDERWSLLSADERRIAELAARGFSNAYLAEVLGLSVRAVELRLTKVYRKLAMSSRGELAVIGRPLNVED